MRRSVLIAALALLLGSVSQGADDQAGSRTSPPLGDLICAPNAALCSEPAPTCNFGSVPSIADGCWDGCVDFGECQPIYCWDDDVCPANTHCTDRTINGLGVCEHDLANCDPKTPKICNSLPPICPDGRVPISGECWGPCIPFEYCAPIPCDCDPQIPSNCFWHECPRQTVCDPMSTNRCHMYTGRDGAIDPI